MAAAKETNSLEGRIEKDFTILCFETICYGKHNARYLGPKIWNKLPEA